MIDLDDDRLALVLASVGDHLLVDAAAAPAPRREPVRSPHRRWTMAIGVAVAMVPVIVIAVAPLRRTVADWLGIGSTRVIIEPVPTTVVSSIPTSASDASSTTTTLPGIVDGLRTIDAATAESLLGAPLPVLDGSSLGAPSRFVRMPEGGVAIAWPTGETLWIHTSTMPAGMMFDKLVASSDSVQRVEALGDDALAVTGDHVLRTPHRTVEATTTVLWVNDDREFRLEGDRSVDDLIAVARQLDTAG
jgi:hypothetical protein